MYLTSQIADTAAGTRNIRYINTGSFIAAAGTEYEYGYPEFLHFRSKKKTELAPSSLRSAVALLTVA
jgi:hypothetical protein